MISAIIYAIFRVSLPLNPSERSGQIRSGQDGQFPDGPTPSFYTILYIGTMIYRTRNQGKKRKDHFLAQPISTKKVKIYTPKK